MHTTCQVGEVSAAAGGGQLLEDVISCLQVLAEVLEAQLDGRAPASWVPPAEQAYIQERAAAVPSADSLPALLVKRLSRPLQAHIERLPALINSSGQLLDPGQALGQIDLLLAQCLLLSLTLVVGQEGSVLDLAEPAFGLLKGASGGGLGEQRGRLLWAAPRVLRSAGHIHFSGWSRSQMWRQGGTAHTSRRSWSSAPSPSSCRPAASRARTRLRWPPSTPRRRPSRTAPAQR